jgi:predicted DNA-binding protein YlxM (UPF0122 family)
MPYIKYKANCKACILSKHSEKHRRRIRQAAFHRQDGDETLAEIATECNISIPSMYNHVKRHMKEVDTTGLKEIRVAKKVVNMQSTAQKEMELQLDRQTIDEIEARPAEIIGIDELIAQGIAEIRAGKMKLTATQFVAAVKVKSDWAGKQQSNKIELLRTISAFRSGAKKGKIDGNTIELTESTDGGEDEPSRIFRAAFGDAATQGTEEILDGHIPPETED